jgi:hypothetical protein
MTEMTSAATAATHPAGAPGPAGMPGAHRGWTLANALNALGGVFGIAILGAVFAAHGSYASPAAFISGFRPAEWVAAAVAATGVIAAALSPSK